MKSPILNNPYQVPEYHYGTNSQGDLDYDNVRPGRRIFKEARAVMPNRQRGQKEIFEWNDDAVEYQTHLVNRCRAEVAAWRSEGYPNTTRVTRELLHFWFADPERVVTQKLFYAQQEAVETAIWLNEVAERSNHGEQVRKILRNAQQSIGNDARDQLPRIAFKMATGTGKTVVMACLICYHYFNRQEYRNDTRFADNFLLVAPGVTIRDRLEVLRVDTQRRGHLATDYYRVRGLVPPRLEPLLQGLNARLVITNYHTFAPKSLKGNKVSPFDGKLGPDGKKPDNLESFDQVLRRLMGKLKKDSRLLVLNDEAHHCYLPKSKGKTTDNEEGDENARAAVWFTGLKEVAARYKLQAVYDLSATPYYLNGSGYEAYSLFPWVVSEFGLIEAIESGLVKIPFLPESDDSDALDGPKLRDLYEHVKDELPRKGQRRQKSEAQAEGRAPKEAPPQMPALVKGALDQFVNHYKAYEEGLRSHQEARSDLFTAPPVFIAVCNNTAVSRELYKYIAGYEFEDAEGRAIAVPGHFELFSNYDPQTGAPRRKPPTLLIDSDALEDSGQVNDEFKKIFAPEIEAFKREYAAQKGQGSALEISDAEILREVVNTVGRSGKLGAHVRCVVSVSMLTEGWDANTVTHIMGLRAFGS